MDKLSVNNKIVSMRGMVERAKVHAAHKLSREVKSLKVLKSWHTEVQRERNRLKADRFTKELLLMKKLNKDDVSKFALLRTKSSMDALRTDPTASVEKKVLARLASHPQLLKSVGEFHSQFPTWESTLPTLLENLGVKVKKRRNMMSITGSLKLVENAETTEEADESVSDDEASKGSLVDSEQDTSVEINKDKKTPKVKKEKTILKTNQKKLVAVNSPSKIKAVGGMWEVEESKDGDDNGNQEKVASVVKPNAGNKKKLKDTEITNNKMPIKKQKLDSSPKLPKSIEKSMTKGGAFKSNSNKVIRFSDLINGGYNKKSTEEDVTPTEEPLLVPATKAVDSFFVSEDGQTEFLSTVAVKEPDVVKDDNKPNKYDKIREKYFNDFGRIPNRKELRLRENQHGSSIFKSFQYNKQTTNDRGYDKMSHKKDQGLATNKMIKSETKISNKWPGEASATKKTVPKVSVVEGPVHPSWEAKRKQKEMLSISAFQGKKITFDD